MTATENEPSSGDCLHRIELHVCDLCLRGEGGECHVPGCVFWMGDAPTGDFRLFLDASARITAAQTAPPEGVVTAGRSSACCARNVPLLDNTRANGALWTCPSCGSTWAWDTDEAEGSAWWPAVDSDS